MTWRGRGVLAFPPGRLIQHTANPSWAGLPDIANEPSSGLEGAMLISNDMNAAINQQIGREFCSSLQYVAVAAYFDSDHLTELAGHFFRQAEEERTHAMRFVRYLLDAGGEVEIPAIPAVRSR